MKNVVLKCLMLGSICCNQNPGSEEVVKDQKSYEDVCSKSSTIYTRVAENYKPNDIVLPIAVFGMQLINLAG